MMEPNDELWRIFHRYNKLVKQNLVPPVMHDFCGNPMVTRLGKNDTLALWCADCDAYVIPGLAFVERVSAQVEEFYL